MLEVADKADRVRSGGAVFRCFSLPQACLRPTAGAPPPPGSPGGARRARPAAGGAVFTRRGWIAAGKGPEL